MRKACLNRYVLRLTFYPPYHRLPVRHTAWSAKFSALAGDRPPAEPGKPELRRYQQIYVRNDVPVGQWSDVVEVTLQP